jgi:hypothetical protein
MDQTTITDPDTGERYEPECEWCGHPTLGTHRGRACCEPCFELLDASEGDAEEPGP